jgi:hypothetical protein
MRKILLGGVAALALAGCSGVMPSDGDDPRTSPGWYHEAPIAPMPPPVTYYDPSAPPSHVRRAPPIQTPDPVGNPDPDPVAVPQPAPPPPNQYSLSDRLRDGWRSWFGGPSRSAPSPPANEGDCYGAWRICHFL